ncbi:glycine zipper 2TM domain-containing protein [Novosphingobium sp. MW5]|nr:glycine zipper 2TM domain-containing protein [Novosphingobium sp. MW5]
MRKSLVALTMAASASLSAPLMAQPAYTYGGATTENSVAYDANGQYVNPQTLNSNDRVWQGEDGQYYCKRKNGTTGLVIGAALGGFLGNRIAGRGNRTLGTIVGAVGGAVLGRELAKGNMKCK